MISIIAKLKNRLKSFSRKQTTKQTTKKNSKKKLVLTFLTGAGIFLVVFTVVKKRAFAFSDWDPELRSDIRSRRLEDKAFETKIDKLIDEEISEKNFTVVSDNYGKPNSFYYDTDSDLDEDNFYCRENFESLKPSNKDNSLEKRYGDDPWSSEQHQQTSRSLKTKETDKTISSQDGVKNVFNTMKHLAGIRHVKNLILDIIAYLREAWDYSPVPFSGGLGLLTAVVMAGSITAIKEYPEVKGIVYAARAFLISYMVILVSFVVWVTFQNPNTGFLVGRGGYRLLCNPTVKTYLFKKVINISNETEYSRFLQSTIPIGKPIVSLFHQTYVPIKMVVAILYPPVAKLVDNKLEIILDHTERERFKNLFTINQFITNYKKLTNEYPKLVIEHVLEKDYTNTFNVIDLFPIIE